MPIVEQPVWKCLEDAREKLEFARAELKDLDDLTFALTSPADTEAQAADVARTYLSWLVFTRQVSVSINEAGKAAGCPPRFSAWWEEQNADVTHKYFRSERNAALKGREEVVLALGIHDPSMALIAYWAFARGPHAYEPLVPRCQLYCEWLYESVLAPACIHLFDWTLKERLASPVLGFEQRNLLGSATECLGLPPFPGSHPRPAEEK